MFEAGSLQPESLPARPSTDLDGIKNVGICHLGLLKLQPPIHLPAARPRGHGT
jgi:hypothetical protein